jgi:hypothetical protein
MLRVLRPKRVDSSGLFLEPERDFNRSEKTKSSIVAKFSFGLNLDPFSHLPDKGCALTFWKRMPIN